MCNRTFKENTSVVQMASLVHINENKEVLGRTYNDYFLSYTSIYVMRLAGSIN
jgi:hypothetical protein